MEAAPLTLAHAHARNAALETRRHNPVAASEEHDLAAAEFAAAAKVTSDSEARRVLDLLEQYHKKLGHMLKTAHEKPLVQDVPAPANIENVVQTSKPDRPRSPETTIHPPRLPRNLRSSTRDMSSSIASNLASARGIPSHRQKRPTPISPLVSNQTADGHIAHDEGRSRQPSQQPLDASDVLLSRSRHLQRPSWAPPMSPAPKAEDAEQPTQSISDAPFQAFYSRFQDYIQKLSAPLAFASLPLKLQEADKSSSPTAQQIHGPKAPKAPGRSTPVAPSIDYSQLISRAALRAVSGTSTSNPAESFYVVPTTGGTISYAEIMSRAEREEARGGLRHHRQTSNLSNISEDSFVDAQSTILPRPASSSGPSRFMRRGGAEEAKVNGKTMEELNLENQALKHLSDTLSKRLHVFEMSAQSTSAALAQSIRSLHNAKGSPMLSPQSSRRVGVPISGNTMIFDTNSTANPSHDDDANTNMQRRINELEEILRKSDAKARKKDEENAKLKDTIVKYRDKWDSLKAGAKARREREKEGRPEARPEVMRRATTGGPDKARTREDVIDGADDG